MGHVHVIPCKAAFGMQIKECMCPREKMSGIKQNRIEDTE
jgi:hypothetical protein